MLKSLTSLLALAALLADFSVQAQTNNLAMVQAPALINKYIQEAKLIGSATHEIAFWDIYDLALYAEKYPFTGTEQPPYALEIIYNRGFSGDLIADKSISLIREQDFEDELRLAEWHSQLVKIFPDVSKGTILTGVYTEEMYTAFYCDGEYLGHIKDPEFGKHFFNIWLGEDSTEPKLRRELIGSESVSSD